MTVDDFYVCKNKHKKVIRRYKNAESQFFNDLHNS